MKTFYHSIVDLMFIGSGGSGGGSSATDISYDNVGSGLLANNVQDAIDEIVTEISPEIPIVKELGEDIAQYKLVYLHSDGKVYKASYESVEKASVLGILIEGGVSGDLKKLVQEGTVVNSSWNWNTGDQKLYVGLDGDLSNTFPTNEGEVIAEIAQIISATSIYLAQMPLIVN